MLGSSSALSRASRFSWSKTHRCLLLTWFIRAYQSVTEAIPALEKQTFKHFWSLLTSTSSLMVIVASFYNYFFRRTNGSLNRFFVSFVIAHFRVALSLLCKPSPSAKPFIWIWVFLSFYKWFCTWPRFKKKAKSNLEMGHSEHCCRLLRATYFQ